MGQVAPPRHGAALGIIAGGCAAFALFVWATGGIDTRIAGIAVRSRSWERPATLAVAVGAIALYRGRAGLLASLPQLLAPLAAFTSVAPALLVAWTLAASLWFGTHAAGGADSYGYVSQAELLARGRLTDTIPLNPAFDWLDVPYTLTPLGYARNARGELAPTYPPGLSLMMAPLVWIDSRAVFAVVPLFAAVAIWLCVRLGRELGERTAGVLAALLLAFSPTFLLQAMQPMSDVPVTALWLAALILARRRAGGAALAGLVSSVAIMVRPNLAPLAALVAAATIRSNSEEGASRYAWVRASVARAAVCIAALVPGLLLLGWIQAIRYGSPLASGYGSFDELFSLANVQPNLARYPRWLIATHSPFLWTWLLAPLVFLGAPPQARVFAWILYAFIVAVFAAYLPYIYFRPDEWSYTRFLLPAIPLMLVLGAAVLLALLRRALPRAAGVVAGLLCCTLSVWCLYTTVNLGVFGLRLEEQKYPRAGAFVRERLPATAFVMAAQHSGSIRYYSKRPTLRWDLLDRSALDRAIASVRRAGFDPFAVLDAAEEQEFRRKFGGANQQAVHAMTPVATIGRAGAYTRVYAFK